jgi:plastocyanin
MIRMVLFFIFFSLLLLSYNGVVSSIQDSNSTITINPGATNSTSQNPISPRNTSLSEGSTIIWLNNDSTPHLIVSGTPDQGPSNKFYGDYFDAGESYNVTLDNAGVYNYYDPSWSHIKGQITIVPNNDTSVEDNEGG